MEGLKRQVVEVETQAASTRMIEATPPPKVESDEDYDFGRIDSDKEDGDQKKGEFTTERRKTIPKK
ncbi:hypothetical protein CONLIGDRAFT_685825 [Coniochaeta ligniaria NRRL 30616]|uniref:Uncharacterized protein n=1 Tax=Coniochaeta ligniaria NRRL 30616 TaxID=1408157 RepID=A0A1J7I979_9PEZI|nr:hypothetical protein CONLIGDRAFT_685825 [Coniochaeta ligniaria NRRL 30616]